MHAIYAYMWQIYSAHTVQVYMCHIVPQNMPNTIWHIGSEAYDNNIPGQSGTDKIMQAAEGLKAVRWQRQAQPSGACTLCIGS